MSIRKIKLLTLFIVILSTYNFASAQDEIASEEDAIYMISYYANQQAMTSIFDTFKVEVLNLEERLESVQLSKEQISNAFDELALKMTTDGDNKLFEDQVELVSEFPSYFDIDNTTKSIDIELLDYQLKDADGKKIKLQGSVSMNYGISSVSSYNNGVSSTIRKVTVRVIHQPQDEQEITEPISGSIKYKAKMATKMTAIKLSKENIGQRFKLNGIPFELIDLYDNKIILNFKEDHDLSISVINMESNEKNERVGLSFMTIHELQQQDEKYENLASFTTLGAFMTKEVYELFKTKPSISLEDFKKSVSIDKLVSKEKYHVIATAAPIEHAVILYTPVYDFEKEIAVELK